MAKTNRLTSRKLLPTAYNDVKALINGNESKIYINEYAYTAILDRSVTLNNTVTSVICEDGLTRSDHVFKDPTNITYKIIVSKVNPSEYNRLMDLYVNRTIFAIVSMAYTCKHCMMNSFKVTDDKFDAFTITVGIIEILYGNENVVSQMDERFQLTNSYGNKVNASYTEGSSQITSDETATYDVALNQTTNIIEPNKVTTTAMETTTSMATFTGNIVYVGQGETALNIISNDNTKDCTSSISINNQSVNNKINEYLSP